jgi:hypothetical protein
MFSGVKLIVNQRKIILYYICRIREEIHKDLSKFENLIPVCGDNIKSISEIYGGTI